MVLPIHADRVMHLRCKDSSHCLFGSPTEFHLLRMTRSNGSSRRRPLPLFGGAIPSPLRVRFPYLRDARRSSSNVKGENEKSLPAIFLSKFRFSEIILSILLTIGRVFDII